MDQANLLEQHAAARLGAAAPLAERMRPRTLGEFIGQQQLLGPGRVLHRLMHHRQMQSLILWGPPGCGKTTLANLIAAGTDARLLAMSAVMAGTKEIRAAVDRARQIWAREQKRTWLFMDEIHRLNKGQQDTLLPHVEQGTVLLLGATTENPSFEIIRPLLSRARVLVLEPLSPPELEQIIARALNDQENGLGRFPTHIDQAAIAGLIAAGGGDARVILNLLETVVLTTAPDVDGLRGISAAAVAEVAQRHTVAHDKDGEQHFNLLSAFHKSLRGSDPDAALYWFLRFLNAGEPALTAARRLVAAASEDVGLADPFALLQATQALQAYQLLGSPEGELALAQAIVYVALAPKSNAICLALNGARELARETAHLPVPLHLRNAPTQLMKDLGYGKKYQYPHDHPGGWVAERYLPEELGETVLYRPKDQGWEGKWRDFLEQRRRQVSEGERGDRPSSTNHRP